MKSLVLVKLGGSLITNKSKPFSLRETVVVDLVKQIKKAWDEGAQIVLGHGSGSFAHVPAEKYKTISGIVDEQSVYGAAVVEDAANQLNRIIVGECLKQGLPAVTIHPFDTMFVNSQSQCQVNLTSIDLALQRGFLPVVFGDPILQDNDQGFTIWSTEVILNNLAENLNQRKSYKVTKIIHCGETDGFLIDKKVVPEINPRNLAEMKKHITDTHGFDVTGGMLHKIEEALQSAGAGIDSYIVGGNHGGNLYRTIVDKDFIGTRITT